MTRPVHFRRVVEICYYNSMSFSTRRECARRVKKCSFILDASRMNEHFLKASEIQ